MFGKNLAKKFAPQIKQAIANQAKPNPSRQLASRGAQAVMSAMKKRGFADGGSANEDMSPEDVAEMKKRLQAGKAYDKAMPDADTSYGDTLMDKLLGVSKPKKDPRDAVRGQRGYASGGKVASASKRADGIATKGKTKGTMVKMNYGGKC
jgi:hypothetical protein